MKKYKSIPHFESEDEEREFWDTHDSTDYFDESKPVYIDLSRLKPSTRPVTVRLPEHLIYSLKCIANKNDVPYQSLMKIYLAERVQKENMLMDAPRKQRRYRRKQASSSKTNR